MQILAENMHFFISKFAAETSHIVSDSRLFTETR